MRRTLITRDRNASIQGCGVAVLLSVFSGIEQGLSWLGAPAPAQCGEDWMFAADETHGRHA